MKDEVWWFFLCNFEGHWTINRNLYDIFRRQYSLDDIQILRCVINRQYGEFFVWFSHVHAILAQLLPYACLEDRRVDGFGDKVYSAQFESFCLA